MTQPWVDAKRLHGAQKSLVLRARHLFVGACRREVRPRPGQAKARGVVDELRQRLRVVGRDAEAAHACVDLQVDRDDLLAVTKRAREPWARHGDAEPADCSRRRLLGDHATHHEDALRVHQAG